MRKAEDQFLKELVLFLSRPDIALLFSLHPNTTVALDFSPPDSWLSWWDWAGEISHDASADQNPKWQLLWRYYVQDTPSDGHDFVHIPIPLREYLRHTRRLQLVRNQGVEATIQGYRCLDNYTPTSKTFPKNVNLHGMSPKKTHEVQYMSAYTFNVLSDLAAHGTVIRHVVDVGAGQVSETNLG